MESEHDIEDSFALIQQYIKANYISEIKSRVKKLTIWKPEDEEEKFSWEYDYDPYDSSRTYRETNDEGSLLDALDGNPDAYWNID